MKHLKKFNEELVPRFPTHNKGEVIVYSKELDYNTAQVIAKKLGYEITGEVSGGFLVKTPIGEEEQAGSDFVDNYPEFFGGSEREDIKDTMIYDELDDIKDDVETLRDSVGSLNKFGKSMLPNDWNDNIDKIINRLQNAKHE